MIYKVKNPNYSFDGKYIGYINGRLHNVPSQEWYCIENKSSSDNIYILSSDNIIYNIFGPKDNKGYVEDAFVSFIKCIYAKNAIFSICFFNPDSILLQFLVNQFELRKILIDAGKMTVSFYIFDKESETHICGFDDLITKSKKIIRTLRKEYYSQNLKLSGLREKPLYGFIREGMPTDSLGPFPEFILPTLPCQKTLKGFCAPCFFSKVEMASGLTQDIKNSLIFQTKYIVEHFDEIIVNYQTRLDGELKDAFDVTFCYACNGSLFSNYETTKEARYQSFKLLHDSIHSRRLKSLVYLETCVDDYLAFLKSDELEVLLPIFKDLNVVILCGFESIDAYIRDVLYVKDMQLSDFQEVITINKKLGLETGAFLYRGFHSLTQNEIIQDTVRSLAFLCANNVMPIIMLPNLQEYTLSHLLYYFEKYNIIDPLTALEIVNITMWFTKKIHNPRRDCWLMGDLFGGPPAPQYSVFTNKRKIVCDNCAENIRKSLQFIRLTNDEKEIKNILTKVKKCKYRCYEKYCSEMEDEEAKRKLFTKQMRGQRNIEFAYGHVEEYIKNMTF